MNESNNNEPIVLGELKKEKSSKPILVLIIFLLIISVCFGLPYIQNYFATGNGPLVDIYNKTIGKLLGNDDIYIPTSTSTTTTTTTTTSTTTTTTTTKKVVTDELKMLNNNTLLELDGIIIEKIVIENNSISYHILSRNSINLDDYNYTLEIYDNDKKLLQAIKLEGYASTASLDKKIDLEFETNHSVYYLKFTKQN